MPNERVMTARRKPSMIRRAELEYAAGIRDEKPHCWTNACPKKRCPGIEIIQTEGAYCSMWLPDEKCPAKGRLVSKGWEDPSPQPIRRSPMQSTRGGPVDVVIFTAVIFAITTWVVVVVVLWVVTLATAD